MLFLHRSPVAISIIVFTMFFGFTLIFVIHTEKKNQLNIKNSTDTFLNEYTDKLIQSFTLYQYGLRGVRGAIVTTGFIEIDRQKFKRYSATRDIDLEFAGAHGFGIIQKIEVHQEKSFLDKARADGFDDLKIRQLYPHDGDKYIIRYVEPESKNLRAIGLDIASEYNRLQAARQAMITGKVYLTAPITLVQTTGLSQQSFLMLMPVYNSLKTPNTAKAREEALWGWSYAPLITQEIISGINFNDDLAHIILTDVTDPRQPIAFYHSNGKINNQTIASATRTVNIFGRKWLIQLETYPTFRQQLNLVRLENIFLVGTIFSFLSSLLVFIVCTNKARKLFLVETQRRLASIVESSIDAIISKTLTGIVTSWNRGAEYILGYTAEEAIGKPLDMLIIPPELRHEELKILERVSHGEYISHFETLRRRKDGKTIDVSVSVSPIINAQGVVIGASKTLRDISAQKKAELSIHQLNVHLEEQVEQRTKQLAQTQRTLRTVLDAVPSMIGYWDKNLINRVANHAYHKFFGINPENLPGTSMQKLLGKSLYESNRLYIEGALSGKEQTFEREIIRPDGVSHYSLSHYLPDMIDGEVQGFYVIVHDVSELVKGRQQLAEALQKNQILLNTINKQLIYSITSPEGNLIEINDLYCKILGQDKTTLIGNNYQIMNAQVHDQAFWQQLWKIVQGGSVWRGELCNRAENGQLYWFDCVISPLFNDNGNITSYLSLGIDITERKTINAEVNQLKLLLEAVLNSASAVSIIATDTEGVITLFNTGAERMLGYSASEMVGKNTPQIIHVREEVEARGLELSKQFGIPIEGFRVFVHIADQFNAEVREWTYVHKDNKHITVSLAVTAVRNTDDNIIGYLGIATDITELKNQKNELLAIRDQLLLATNVARLGIWSWVLNTNLIEWSTMMYTLYAKTDSATPTKMTWEKWQTYIHPDDIEQTQQAIQSALKGKMSFNPSFRIIHPDGAIRHIQAAGYIERDHNGTPVRVTGINLDITERREFEEKILLAKQQAEQANIAKGHFLANISHEIRTPLNAVLGMLQLLLKTDLASRQRDYTQKAQQAAKSLLSLLNDVLDFSKIEAGKVQLDIHLFDLELLIQALSSVLVVPNKKDIEVIFDIDPKLPMQMMGDQLKLQQILINLAGNALKFTELGQVIIRFVTLDKQINTITLRIEVIDTGIGISLEQQQIIFQSFTQAEASTTRRFGGTGLGLGISQGLVSIMGSKLLVESELGKGSRFWFDLELNYLSTTPNNILNLPDSLHILIVDDNAYLGEVLKRTLQSMNCIVEYVNNGQDALAKVQYSDSPYDLILMDWRMPEWDGIQTAEAIRQLACHDNKTFIIMMTASGQEVLAQHFSETSPLFDELLIKPITPQQLLNTIQRFAKHHQNKPAIEHLESRTYSLQNVQILVVEDNDLNREIINELLCYEGAIVTLAYDGVQGVEFALDEMRNFDVIIMDMQMPNMDGLEATRRIRQYSQCDQIPIIAMTANATTDDRMICLETGMNDHIGKPVDMQEMVQTILRLLNKKPLESYRHMSNKMLPLIDQHLDSYDLILQRFNGSKRIFQKALVYFLPQCSQLIQNLNHQLDFEAEDAANTLHTLAGVSSTIGASKLAAMAIFIEQKIRAGEQINDSQKLLEKLQNLLIKSDEQLKEYLVFIEPQESVTSQSSNTQSISELNVCLVGELSSLESGSMKSIKTIELILQDINNLNEYPLLTLLQDQIKKLDFNKAAQTVRQWLNTQ